MILKFISDAIVFFSSTVKFALGASAVVTGDMGISGTICNFLGGVTGILIFTFLGSYIRLWLIRTFPDQLGRRFTKSSRFLVKVRQNFGLNGIAFLTPIFLSIPVGVLLAMDLYAHKRRMVMTSMVFSCLFWSAVFFVPYYAFNINVVGWVRNMF